MARVKLSEYRSKYILNKYLGLPWEGIFYDAEKDSIGKLDETIDPDKTYVVKVDQGIKKRFKQGLVKLDLIGVNDIVDALAELRKKGYRHFIIEEMVGHESQDEKYLALSRTDKGIVVSYSVRGGVNIEDNSDTVSEILYKDSEDVKKIAVALGVDTESFMEKLLEAFDIFYFSFLEINPLVVSFKKPYLLDIAAEVDSAAEFFVDEWTSDDIRESRSDLTEEEVNIRKLSEKSSSSLTLRVLNPNGSIFMLLSGGGVSVAMSDEVANLGRGADLANYGEYSGNPTEEETYIYTKNLLSLLLRSTASRKVLIIGGGVANFTDIRITFKGVIRALEEVSDDLQKQGLKVFVRRGGPHQKEGLSAMQKFLAKNNMMGEVSGPEIIISEIVQKALKEI